ncbi:unnamed protein product [Lactuca saligna]|uniref:GPI-anchored protein LLG1-like domain-containing protein n=1 Tax=Lactuca saligna TaxID=75948 RepID=A0AA36A417_LACSI|nr:unnamed protein product [Lactuca saligna]
MTIANFCFLLPLLLLPFSLSDNAFPSQPSIGRNLLQDKKPCPLSFETMNYTIITSRCKGPKYPPNLCCQAFKDFACPYADELNDLSNQCSTQMFSYINLYGSYPPGIFSNLCHDNKAGLVCDAVPPQDSTSNNISDHFSLLLILVSQLFLIMFLP